MNAVINVVTVLAANLLLGRLIAHLIDSPHRGLRVWLSQAPSFVAWALVLECWPILFFSVHTRWRNK